VPLNAATYFVFLVVLLEAQRQPLWKQVGIRWGILTCCAFYFYTFLFLICCCHGLVCCDLHPTYPFSGCCGHGPLWHSSFDVGQSYFIWEISRFICTKIRSILNAWDASWVWNPLPSYLRTGRQEGWWVMTRKEHPGSLLSVFVLFHKVLSAVLPARLLFYFSRT